MDKEAGFTLLEVMIAIVLFAMIGLTSYQLLDTALTTKDITLSRSEKLTQLQHTLRTMAQDLRQLVDRTVRNEEGDAIIPALTTESPDYSIEFTRRGWRNPLGTQRSELQRVGYKLDDQVLKRYYWTVLDRTETSAPLTQTMLENIDAVTIAFLDENYEWQTTWPIKMEEEKAMPLAVEITLTIEPFGKVRRIFEVVRP